MNFKYFGHSCFLMELSGKQLLFDPFISGNPLAKNIKIEEICPDFIFISHGHGDHIGDLVQIAKESNAQVITSFDLMTKFMEPLGISGHGMNIGGTLDLHDFKVKVVNAVHSSMLPDNTYGGSAMGFVIWNHRTCFYYSGDTALTYDMKLIPMICPKLNFAILPVGDYFTMGYKDAIIASDFIECNQIIGCHFDSFPPIQINQEDAKKAFSDAGKTLILPEIGKVFEV